MLPEYFVPKNYDLNLFKKTQWHFNHLCKFSFYKRNELTLDTKKMEYKKNLENNNQKSPTNMRYKVSVESLMTLQGTNL